MKFWLYFAAWVVTWATLEVSGLMILKHNHVTEYLYLLNVHLGSFALATLLWARKLEEHRE